MLISAIGTSQTITIITTITLTLVLGLVLTISGKKFDTKMLAYCAISIALSFALSYIKVFTMPYGGSITIGSFVPLIIFSYIYGFRSGLFAGSIYGLLQIIQGLWFLTPEQFLLDYILAFTAIAGAGVISLIVKNHKKGLILSVPVVFTIRLIIHILAGFIFYSSFSSRAESIPLFGDTSAMAGLTYSTLYNLTYVLPDMIISLAIVIFLTANQSFVRLIDVLSYNNKDIKYVSKKDSNYATE